MRGDGETRNAQCPTLFPSLPAAGEGSPTGHELTASHPPTLSPFQPLAMR